MIDEAHALLARGDAHAALEQLLAAWRAAPSRELASVIEVVGVFAARGLHAPGGTSAADREERWLAEARRGDPVMRQRLLDTITDTAQHTAKVARARALADTAKDPRIATRLVALATRTMPRHKAFSTVWNPLFEMLAQCGDPRVREDIAAAPWDEIVRGTQLQRAAFRERLAKYNAKLARAFPEEPPAFPARDAAVVDNIYALARAPGETDERDRECPAETFRDPLPGPLDPVCIEPASALMVGRGAA